MEGDHPKPSEGEVERLVRFQNSYNTKFRKVKIRVINCGSYYVYYLPDVPGSNYGYCIVE